MIKKNYTEEKSPNLVKTTEKYSHKIQHFKTFRAVKIKLKVVNNCSIKDRAC